ncbi:Crp/Fnr family transcriptional regulator [Methyloraptor flagellatus]|uniref:Crp/Fnr family transcriptional regulator n=1 Tax=Methyloraptor flagellatus TaxID=3162530 RepID=A0AAU7X578_9HYPH
MSQARISIGSSSGYSAFEPGGGGWMNRPLRMPARRANRPISSLEAFELFEGIEEADRLAFERDCVWRDWKKGSTIIGRDSLGGLVYFVVAGRCRVTLRAGRRDVVLDEIGPGEMVGEISAIDGERRSAAVTASTATRTAEVGADRFMAFLLRHPPAALIVMRRLAQVIRQADAAILELSGLNAPARICVELMRRARVGGGLPPNAAQISPLPKHADIAMRAATTRETVVRTLSDLVQRGLLRRDTDRFVLPDVEALIRLTTTADEPSPGGTIDDGK